MQAHLHLKNDVRVVAHKAGSRPKVQDAGGVGALLPIGVDMRHDVVPHFLFARGGDFVS